VASTQLCKELSFFQVNVNSRIRDVTQTPALHLAAVSGNEMLVRMLLLAGALIDDTDANRNTALHIAAKAGHAAIISALLQVNSQLFYLLRCLTINNHTLNPISTEFD